ncbi:hypothetical protein AFE_1019 [Acidithiobacillus ferrooxidans ATCC 23270]|uniref:Uncharacterized protein n=1 Tax=Acidithiobacillus ferrooxidans (strain ATCC 23270 / DSM 14882 / CIP 104768 / NCIMB 8455) TaxID=243159 RepID=B7J7J4_ACIF2|nr:hypothetical protein AFE_1019 [Acidithiobacillus ferrooxidans ATCC 23270]
MLMKALQDFHLFGANCFHISGDSRKHSFILTTRLGD